MSKPQPKKPVFKIVSEPPEKLLSAKPSAKPSVKPPSTKLSFKPSISPMKPLSSISPTFSSEKVSIKKLKSRVEYLANLNFSVIPLFGKKPILSGWQNLSVEDGRVATLKAIEDSRANNIGINCGIVSDMVVIDIDIRENGIRNWLDMIEGHKMEETFTVETGSGGYHIYYQYDERLSKSRKLSGLGIDFKSNGGQVVAPGSIHLETQQLYYVVYGFHKGEMYLATFPEFLIEKFRSEN